MKTAMQELMEWIEHWKNEPLSEFQQNKIKELLEKEKEQIIESFDNGIYVGTYAVDKDGEQYYNRTYTQDRELGKEITDLLENYKKDKTFKQKSKWT
jgi:murein endopeptidase